LSKYGNFRKKIPPLWRHFSHKNPLYELHWNFFVLPSGQNSPKEKTSVGQVFEILNNSPVQVLEKIKSKDPSGPVV
jgi:hypothetical protein